MVGRGAGGWSFLPGSDALRDNATNRLSDTDVRHRPGKFCPVWNFVGDVSVPGPPGIPRVGTVGGQCQDPWGGVGPAGSPWLWGVLANPVRVTLFLKDPSPKH